jgi:hypothetical protein
MGKNKKRGANGYLGVFKVRMGAAAERARIDANTDGIDRMIDAMILRALGKIKMETAEGVIYTLAPDPQAAKLLIEMGFGKAKESIEIEDASAKLKGVPQVILVPPKWWIAKHGKGK